jgi:hypothetical protein
LIIQPMCRPLEPATSYRPRHAVVANDQDRAGSPGRPGWTVDRHPLASVGTLVLGLRCSWCPGSAPMAKLLGLYALPPERRNVIGG